MSADQHIEMGPVLHRDWVWHSHFSDGSRDGSERDRQNRGTHQFWSSWRSRWSVFAVRPCFSRIWHSLGPQLPWLPEWSQSLSNTFRFLEHVCCGLNSRAQKRIDRRHDYLRTPFFPPGQRTGLFPVVIRTSNAYFFSSNCFNRLATSRVMSFSRSPPDIAPGSCPPWPASTMIRTYLESQLSRQGIFAVAVRLRRFNSSFGQDGDRRGRRLLNFRLLFPEYR